MDCRSKQASLVKALKRAVRAKGELLDALLTLVKEGGLERDGGCDPADIEDLDWHLGELAVAHCSPEEIEELGITEVRRLLETAEQQRCMVLQLDGALQVAQLEIRDAPVVVSDDIFWVQTNGLVQVPDSQPMLA